MGAPAPAGGLIAAAASAFDELGRRRVDRLYGPDAYAVSKHAELVHGALTSYADGMSVSAVFIRTGARVVTSWTSQVLPSGSTGNGGPCQMSLTAIPRPAIW